MSTIYLLHLKLPLSPGSPSRHYLGFTDDLIGRILAHQEGRSGARYMEVCAERGIAFALARTWEGKHVTRTLERKLKKRHDTPRLCPICNPNALRLGILKEVNS